MAHRIPVQDSRDHVKKSVAQLLIRRLLAVGLYEDGRLVAIRRVAIRQITADAFGRQPIAPKAYIPKVLPPIEPDGHTFEPPKRRDGYNWAAQHRACMVMARQIVNQSVSTIRNV